MSFETWFKRYALGVVSRMPWVKAEMRAAFLAGQAYEKALAKKRKPRKDKTP